MVLCVAHQEKTPSLRVTEKDGRTLFHCFGGCEQAAVLEALKARGLWKGRSKTTSPPGPRQKPRDQRELRWLLDDVHLLDADPAAAQIWTFLEHAAVISPAALDRTAYMLSDRRPRCRPLINLWFNAWFETSIAPGQRHQEEAA